MNATIYARFSPRPNADECQSIAVQRDRCTAYCTANGYTVGTVYEDAGLSGASTDRPGLQKALTSVCESKGILVVYSLDRLARNTRDAIEISERLNKSSAELACVAQSINTHTSHGRFFFTLLAAIATLEREQIAERTSVAMQSRQKRGHRMSRYAPYGYRLDGRALVPEPEEQELARQIIGWHKSGDTMRIILLKLRVTSCRGSPWHRRVVEGIIRRAL